MATMNRDYELLLRTIVLFALSLCVSSTTQSTPVISTSGSVVPGKVTDLNVTFVSSHVIGLSWKPPNPPYTGFGVMMLIDGQCQVITYMACSINDTVYAQDHNCPLTNVGYPNCIDGSVYFNDTDLLAYTYYDISVITVNKFNESDYVNTNATTKIGIPDPPASVECIAFNASSIRINWVIPDHLAGPTSYTVFVLEAIDRTETSKFIQTREYTVKGYNSSTVEVGGLLTAWRYMVGVAAVTLAGESKTTMSKVVDTLPSAPGIVQNLAVSYVSDQYMAVQVRWDCPREKERNGHITAYTVEGSTTANGSLTIVDGGYYPEDFCVTHHSVYLPVLPNTEYNISVYAHAEYQGIDNSITFFADLSKMKYIITPVDNKTATEITTNGLEIAGGVLGAFIGVEILVIIAFFIPREKCGY